MVRDLFWIQPRLHEKLPLATPLAISKMVRCRKKQKRAVILRRKRLLQRCFFPFEKSSFLVKTVLLKKIQKLDVAYEEYNRNPRRVGYLALGHGARTSLRSVRTPWSRAKYFPVRPSHAVNKYILLLTSSSPDHLLENCATDYVL